MTGGTIIGGSSGGGITGGITGGSFDTGGGSTGGGVSITGGLKVSTGDEEHSTDVTQLVTVIIGSSLVKLTKGCRLYKE